VAWRGSFAVSINEVVYWINGPNAVPVAVATGEVAHVVAMGDDLLVSTQPPCAFAPLSDGAAVACQPAKHRMVLRGCNVPTIAFRPPHAPRKVVCVGGGRVLLLLRNYNGCDAVVPMDVRAQRWGPPLVTAFFIADFTLSPNGELAAVVSSDPTITAPQLVTVRTGWRLDGAKRHPRAAAAAAVVRLLPLPPEILDIVISFVGEWNLGH
jgi:hypothetical protein